MNDGQATGRRAIPNGQSYSPLTQLSNETLFIFQWQLQAKILGETWIWIVWGYTTGSDTLDCFFPLQEYIALLCKRVDCWGWHESFRLVVELILCIPMSIDELCLCEVGMDTDGGYIHIIRMGLQYLSIVMQVTSNLYLYSTRYILSYSVDCHVVISLAILWNLILEL